MPRIMKWLLATSLLLVTTGCDRLGTPIPTSTASATSSTLSEAANTATTSPKRAASPTPPAAPTSLSKPVVYFSSIYMKSKDSGWAVGSISPDDDEYYFPPRILTTRDAARTWADRSPPLPETDPDLLSGYTPGPSFYFLDDSYGWAIYPGQTQPVWRTTDGGATWQASSSTFNTRGVGSDLFFLDRSTGWMLIFVDVLSGSSVSTHLFQTLDGGANWRSLASAYDGGILNSCGKGGMSFAEGAAGWIMLSCPDTPPTFLLSADGGRTWRQTYAPAPVGGQWNQCSWYNLYDPTLFSAKEGAFVLSCSGASGSLSSLESRFLYKTHDAGRTWTTSLLPAEHIVFLNPDTAWSFGESTLSLSTDGGASWPTPKVFSWAGSFSFLDDSTVYAISTPLDTEGKRVVDKQSLLLSIDGGKTWEPIPIVLLR